eukprot:10635536-Heterocapsa_arctica.AAC.1
MGGAIRPSRRGARPRMSRPQRRLLPECAANRHLRRGPSTGMLLPLATCGAERDVFDGRHECGSSPSSGG